MSTRQISRSNTIDRRRPEDPMAALIEVEKLDSKTAKLNARQSFPINLPGVARSVSMSPAHFLAVSLGNRWRAYTDEHRKVLQSFSVEPVHELRVASRRLMAHLDLLDAVVPSNAIE